MALKELCPEKETVNAQRKKYHHITYEDRVQIEGWVKAGLSPSKMAELIGCNERTIKRELANVWIEKQSDWTLRRRYTYDFAQTKHEERAAKKGRRSKLKTRPELVEFLVEKIKNDRYSPEAAWFAARNEGQQVDVSVKTLYNTIDRGELGTVKRRDLLRKEGWKKEKQKPRKGSHTKGLSIELRPKAANERSELGHWEGDLIVSCKSGRGALLTLTERLSRDEVIMKLASKEQLAVENALKTLAKSKHKFKSITWDNGSEFLDYQRLQAALPGMICYYAHPFSSFERGSNENANGIIRRFFPKGTDFSRVSARKIARTQNWINNYPRKILNGYSSKDFLLRLDN